MSAPAPKITAYKILIFDVYGTLAVYFSNTYQARITYPRPL